MQPAFFNYLTGDRKTKICVRVDGGHDKGPYHEEVQFWWMCYHLDKESEVLTTQRETVGQATKTQ